MQEDDNLISEFLHKYTMSNKNTAVASTALPGRSIRTKKNLIRNSKSGTTLKSSTRAFSDTRDKNMLFLRPGSSLPNNRMKKKRIVSSMPYQKYNPKAKKNKLAAKKRRPFTAVSKKKKIKPMNPNLQAHFKKNFRAFKINKKKKNVEKKKGAFKEIEDMIARNEEAIRMKLNKIEDDKIEEIRREEEFERLKKLRTKSKSKKTKKTEVDPYYGCQTNWEHTRDKLKDNTIAFLNKKIVYFNDMQRFLDEKFGKRVDGIQEIMQEMVK